MKLIGSTYDESEAVKRVYKRVQSLMDSDLIPTTVQPKKLAYAFPSRDRRIGIYKYEFERAQDRETAGYAVCCKDELAENVTLYMLACLADGNAVEIVRLADPGNVTSLFLNAEKIGTITGGEQKWGKTVAWEIKSGDSVIGTVRRGFGVGRMSLHVERSEKPPIQLVLTRKEGLYEVLKTLGRLLTFFIWIFKPAPPNTDLVVPSEALEAAPDVPIWLHAAISIFFRLEIGLGFHH